MNNNKENDQNSIVGYSGYSKIKIKRAAAQREFLYVKSRDVSCESSSSQFFLFLGFILFLFHLLITRRQSPFFSYQGGHIRTVIDQQCFVNDGAHRISPIHTFQHTLECIICVTASSTNNSLLLSRLDSVRMTTTKLFSRNVKTGNSISETSQNISSS